MAPRGLTLDAVAEQVHRGGRNELPTAPVAGPLAIVWRQLTDPVVLVLLAAGVLTILTGDVLDASVIASVVVLNTGLGTWQELKSTRAIAALTELTAARATVVRDARTILIDARDVVVGDLVLLAAGDIVAADGRVVDAVSLGIDESLLTGESVPAAIEVGREVFGGTVVTRGRGSMVITAIGGSSQLGDIAHAISITAPRPTPLQQQLGILARRLALVAALAALAVGLLSWLQGTSVVTSVVLAVSLAVAAIPESLPAVVTVALAMAARHIAAVGVLARSLASVEALGSVTVIACDKTGTLTTGQMSLTHTWLPAPGPDAERNLRVAAALCNDAATSRADDGGHDDPLETALVRGAVAAGIDVGRCRREFPRTGEQPFDTATARMRTDHAGVTGPFSVTKGSPESILAMIDDCAVSAAARAAAERMAADGERVLAVARRQGDADLVLLGLLGLDDPPRPDAPTMIAAFRAAGVTPVMITGDHPATARAVGAAIGIDPVDVHARVRPEGKTAIIEALRADGEVVAMTGDGVNDAPALRAADIGVAMGARGSEVAKQAATLVLAGDRLAAMIPAIVEGRRAYDNVRRFLTYGLAGGAAEVFVMIVGPLLGFAIPLQAGQILWINLLTHGLPGVAMGNDPVDGSAATRPPRPRLEGILNRVTVTRIAALSAVVSAASLTTALTARHLGAPWQSQLFLSLLLVQLAVALGLRPRRARWVESRWLLASVGVNVVLGLLAVTWQPLAQVLRLPVVAWWQIVLCVPAVAVVWVSARMATPSRSDDDTPRRQEVRPRSGRGAVAGADL